MVIIKKILSILLAVILIAAVFAGCTKPVDNSVASPFSVYRIKDGVRISLGDKRENIEKIIDITPDIIVEYEDDPEALFIFEQVIYEDIAFDYDKDGNVLGIDARSADWKIENGLKVTDSTEDVKRNYPAEFMHTYKQNDDIYLSLDENGEIIAFSEDAPFILRFNIDQHAARRIIIKKNVF